MIWTGAFWRGAAERAIKTFAQALAAALGTGAIGILDVNWAGALSIALIATILSVLTSVGNADFTAGNLEADTRAERRKAAKAAEINKTL